MSTEEDPLSDEAYVEWIRADDKAYPTVHEAWQEARRRAQTYYVDPSEISNYEKELERQRDEALAENQRLRELLQEEIRQLELEGCHAYAQELSAAMNFKMAEERS